MPSRVRPLRTSALDGQQFIPARREALTFHIPVHGPVGRSRYQSQAHRAPTFALIDGVDDLHQPVTTRSRGGKKVWSGLAPLAQVDQQDCALRVRVPSPVDAFRGP